MSILLLKGKIARSVVSQSIADGGGTHLHFMGPEPADVDGRWTRPLSQRIVNPVTHLHGYYSLTDPGGMES